MAQKQFWYGLISAACSGLLIVLSLPKPDLYPLAWIAFVPLLCAIVRAPALRQAALVSYVSGVVFFAGTFYWVGETMMTYGGLDPFSAVGLALLFSLVYAIHFVLAGSAVWLAVRRWGYAGLFAAAPFWVAVEWLRAHWNSGFPWMLSGYALAPFSGLLQIVAWTGIYGLSFVQVAVNCGLALALLRRRWGWASGSVAVAVALSLLPILPAPSPASGDPLAVRLVQTNIPLDFQWKEPQTGQLLDELSRLSEQGSAKARLIVWPETPAPFYLSEDPELARRIARIAHTADSYVLLGYIDKNGDGPTNSVGLVDPQGRFVSRYDKIHLVPFGEYVPLKNLLFFAESLTRQVGDFKPGTEFVVSPIDQHRFSTAICYESIFPDLVREFVNRGAELLVVITNDGWFGVSSAPFQHLRMGVVRAAENRRYEVRTANTGISALIDPYGRIESSTPIGVRMALDGIAHFRSDKTFYTKYGDLFAYANMAASLLLVALLRLRAAS